LPGTRAALTSTPPANLRKGFAILAASLLYCRGRPDARGVSDGRGQSCLGGELVAKQLVLSVAALLAMSLTTFLTVPPTAAQTYPYPQGYQGYTPGAYPPDPNAQYYGQYNYGGYAPPAYGNGALYGQSYNYGYGAYPGQSGYAPPPAYTGYASAYPSYYGAPPQAPGYYGQNQSYPAPGYYGQPQAYPPPNYYGGYQPPYPGAFDANLMVPPPLGLPYAPPPTVSPNGFTLTATLTGPNAAVLSWNGIPGAVSYAIYQATNNGPLQFTSTSTGTKANVPLNFGSMAFQVHALTSGGAELLQSNVATPVPGPVPGLASSVTTAGGPGVPYAANSSVIANLQQGASFTGAPIIVTVLDSAHAPVSGRLVNLVASRQGDTVAPANGTTPVTDQSGRAAFIVRPSQPGQGTFTAYVDGIQVGQTLVNFQ
jgi:hypothetical protein